MSYSPPAIILGGDLGALSIARSLGASGVPVYVINQPHAAVRYSRFARSVGPLYGSDAWMEYLLGPASDALRGGVLLAASDEAIEMIADHRTELGEKYRLDISFPPAQRAMLDKLCTYEAATAAGVPTPKFWVADTWEQVLDVRPELVFPLIVKPVVGHQFSRSFKGGYSVVQNFEELGTAFSKLANAGIRAFLVELIPGPDSYLCSYYTYMDENGEGLFDFTKRIIRRYPAGMGTSTYHVTNDVPGIKDPALRLFRHVGLRGIANVEFKVDPRDGIPKLIECNARFTAADCLLVASGLNLPLFVYNRITHRMLPPTDTFQVGMRLWKPHGDIAAFRELRQMGLLSFGEWVKSILHPQVLPVFRWNDPLPAIVDASRTVRHDCARLRLLFKSSNSPASAAAEAQL